MERTVVSLATQTAALPAAARRTFEHIFSIRASTSRLELPPLLQPRAAGWFAQPGDTGPEQALARVECQVVVEVTNKVTGESTLFNSLRALKPAPTRDEAAENALDEQLEQSKGEDKCALPHALVGKDTRVLAGEESGGYGRCDFCAAETRTAAEPWGRVRGDHCVTCANIARAMPLHGLVLFGKHHPHRFGLDEVVDLLRTFTLWSARTRSHAFNAAVHAERDAVAPYATLLWNCMPKAGASQPHGHAQMVLSESYMGKPAALANAAAAYQPAEGAGSGGYWNDWVEAHAAVGLAHRLDDEVAVVVTMTPLKEREMVVVGPHGADADHATFARALCTALRTLLERCHTRAFNVAVYVPPAASASLAVASVPPLPLLARVVDRGALTGPSDIAAFEMFGTPVVASDPYRVMDSLREQFGAHE